MLHKHHDINASILDGVGLLRNRRLRNNPTLGTVLREVASGLPNLLIEYRL